MKWRRRSEKIVHGLNMVDLSLDQPFRELKWRRENKGRIRSAVVEKPELLLLDEPTNHLDFTGCRMVRRIFKEL